MKKIKYTSDFVQLGFLIHIEGYPPFLTTPTLIFLLCYVLRNLAAANISLNLSNNYIIQ